MKSLYESILDKTVNLTGLNWPKWMGYKTTDRWTEFKELDKQLEFLRKKVASKGLDGLNEMDRGTCEAFITLISFLEDIQATKISKEFKMPVFLESIFVQLNLSAHYSTRHPDLDIRMELKLSSRKDEWVEELKKYVPDGYQLDIQGHDTFYRGRWMYTITLTKE